MAGTWIHGIGASEHIDSSGEKVMIDGVDISSLPVSGVFNFEHENKESSQIVGKIYEAKKIFTEADCENEYHRAFWNKVKMPYLYVAGELFDGAQHKGAEEVAAMLRYDASINNDKVMKVVNFSIEGSRVDVRDSIVHKCIARKIAITVTPCNKVCQAEEMNRKPMSKPATKQEEALKIIGKVFGKSEVNCCELFKDEKYSKVLEFKTKIGKPSGKENFKPLTPNAPLPSERKPATPIEPKKTVPSSAVTSQEKLKTGTRLANRPERPKTGSQIYNDPKTFATDKAKPPVQRWKMNKEEVSKENLEKTAVPVKRPAKQKLNRRRQITRKHKIGMTPVETKYRRRRRRQMTQQYANPMQKNELLKHDFAALKGKDKNPIHGFILPDGQYHHMKPEESHQEELENLGYDSMDDAIDQGVVTVGHGGDINFNMNTDTFRDRFSPAHSTLRKLMKQHWGHHGKVRAYVGDNDNALLEDVDLGHFIKHGKLRTIEGQRIDPDLPFDPEDKSKSLSPSIKPTSVEKPLIKPRKAGISLPFKKNEGEQHEKEQSYLRFSKKEELLATIKTSFPTWTNSAVENFAREYVWTKEKEREQILKSFIDERK